MMKIIICGAGQVGSSIAQQLAREGNEVTIIDQNAELISDINDKFEVKAIKGYASHPDVLAKAGLAEADMIIAVTCSDEVNMIACQVAYTLFKVPVKIARVRHRDYLKTEWKSLYSSSHLPIDFIISPEMEVAEAILRRLHAPGAIDTLPFADDILKVIAIRCEQNCPMNNLPVSIIKNRLSSVNQRIIAIVHQNKLQLPKDNMILHPDDIVYSACDSKDIQETLRLFGHEEKEARRIVILGGGNIGFYIAQSLEDDNFDTRVQIIEFDKERGEKIAQELEDTTVISGSGLDKEILIESGIETAETIICVTNDDKTNILSSLLAKRYGCERSISLVNNNSYIPLLGKLGVDVVINPRESTISSILQHIRLGKIRDIHSIRDGAAEIIEAEVVTGSEIIGKSITSLRTPKNVLIAAIIRNNKIIFPDDDTVMIENDHVIIICQSDAIKKVEQFFAVDTSLF